MGDSLFSSPVIDKLLGVDVSCMTPIEAISFLYSLQKMLKKEVESIEFNHSCLR